VTRSARARVAGGGGRLPFREASNLLTDLFSQPLDPGYAEAARRRAAEGPPTRSRRVGGRSGRVVALVLVGFLLSVAYQQVVAEAAGTNRTRTDLAADVADRRAEADRLARDADRLRGDVSRRRDQALAADPELARLRDLEARSGLARVTGDGVVVTVSDAPEAVDPVTGRTDGDNPGRVLDRDLQDVANGLWQAGAEAIAINGQRLTSTSTIRAAGAAILVDYRPVSRPYVLAAIGAPGLDRRLADSSTGKRFRRLADAYRMQFEVRKRDGLTLPAGADPGLRYARPPQPSASPSVSPSGGGR
jgi:uncharacterized protein YlxW (UPF0749 family)